MLPGLVVVVEVLRHLERLFAEGGVDDPAEPEDAGACPAAGRGEEGGHVAVVAGRHPPRLETRALVRNVSEAGSSVGPGTSGSAESSRRPKFSKPKDASAQAGSSENSTVAPGPTVGENGQGYRPTFGVPMAPK